MADEMQLKAYRDLLDQVGAGANAGGMVAQTAFTQFFCEFLTDPDRAHFINDLTPVYLKKLWKSGYVRVDAYNFDEQTHDLTLVVSEFSCAAEPESIGQEDVKKLFKQARRFFRACGVLEFVQGLEDSEGVMPLVFLIRDNRMLISRVRYILMTNKTLGRRVKDESFDDLKKEDSTLESEFTVWDFQRYYDTLRRPGESEIDVDCRKFTEGEKGLPFLTSADAGLVGGSKDKREYSAYMLMVPGRSIYEWYARYADRLLEQNVRTFLQFRGKVNRGIRETLHGEPSRFLAYNNGLTATAESVKFDSSGRHIIGIHNLQIVNGGQTTASIYTAFASSDEVPEAISVQMKLIVTAGAHVEDFVSRISRYANSQNKIKDTDFASNKQFMLRMEVFSRTVTANRLGTLRGTRWFFERTRGQYLNMINMCETESERNKLRALYPKDQVFTKTDLSKYILSWDWCPFIVARGAEKAFVEFEQRHFGSDTDDLPGREHVKAWRANDTDGNPQFNEYYYYESVGKAILYRDLDKALRKCEWCKGYKSQLLTYTIAGLHFMVYGTGKVFDFMPIWNGQSVPMVLLDFMVEIAHDILQLMLETALGRNVSEWTKKGELWVSVKKSLRNKSLPTIVQQQFLISPDELEHRRMQSERKQVESNEKLLVRLMMVTDDKVWVELKSWMSMHQLKASNAQSSALDTRIFQKNFLTVQDAKKLRLLWTQASKEGFPYPPMSEIE